MKHLGNEDRFLGKQGSYAVITDKFDPSYLTPMLRSKTREEYGITGNEFLGFDIWNCHESTFLTDNGLPVSGTLKIMIPSQSLYLPESKSFKLYLNSFDMCKMGNTVEIAIKNYQNQVKIDLSECLKYEVKVKFFKANGPFTSADPAVGYMDLDKLIPSLDSEIFDDYNCSKEHLAFKEVESEKKLVYKVYTSLLRSRCRYTKQKDTGNAFFHIIMKEGWDIDLVSLLKQVISLRMLDEFHEFCSERLFIDLMKTGKVESCSVMLLYARRGSLDINPIRVSDDFLFDQDVLDINRYLVKQQNQ